MNYDEAMIEAVSGELVRCDEMQEGSYVEYEMSRGFLRCWNGHKADRSQCDFQPRDSERASASWATLDLDDVYPPPFAASVWSAPAPAPPASPIAAAWGITIPGAAPAIDLDTPAPVKDKWGRTIS